MKFNSIFKFNKYTLIFLIIWFIGGVGATFAYYAYQYEEESVIVGSVVGVNVDLDVELIVGKNGKLVPLETDALPNALTGYGSDNGPCVDSVGNLSCQVYKITLVNYGSRVRHVNGTIELYAQEGEGNVYNNLKWIELENPTTIKASAFKNGMAKSTLISNLTIETKAVGIWYIAVWLEETDEDQLNTDKGKFGGLVKFESDLLIGDGLVENVLERNAENDKYLDFSKTSAEGGTNGIYVKNDTTDDSYPIYYWRGAVENNLIFAEHCWKMVRTTGTGGLKLLYNGHPTDNNGSKECNNMGDDTILGKSMFHTTHNSLAYSGYMFNDDYFWTRKNLKNSTTTYHYANNVTYNYETNEYEFVDVEGNDTDVISSSSWANIWNGGINNNHYACLEINIGGKSCSSVNYIYYTTATYAYYFTLSGGAKIEDAVASMLGADDSNIESYNSKSSAIKVVIDQFYVDEIAKLGYSSYLEDTVWCNDRRMLDEAGLNPNGGITTNYVKFQILDRTWHTFEPTLECVRKVDSFTKDDKVNGNGKLSYPIGLLTPDEIMLAGGKGGFENDDYYLYNEGNYWSSAPNNFYSNKVVQVYINSDGFLNGSHIDATSIGVRPAISLKHGYVIASGKGTKEEPFVIDAPPIISESEE